MPTLMLTTIRTCDQCFRSSLKAIPSIMMSKMEVVLVMVYRATVTNLRLHWLRPMSQEEATPTGATLERYSCHPSRVLWLPSEEDS